MQTIGILLPRSTYYDSISFDMHEGLRSGLRAIGINDVRIVTENIGFGAEKQQCYRSAEKLLLEENASIVFAYVGQRTAQLLRPIFLAAKRLLIVLDAGANLPSEWPVSPNILYHSLNNSTGAYIASELALRDGFRSAGMVSCYYDGGYLHTYAITHGFADNGGAIGFNHVTGYTTQDFSMAALPEHIKNYPEACLLSIFSGDYCEWFLRDLKGIFEDNVPPVYMPPFGFEESMLSKAIFPGNKIKGVAAWSRELNNSENTAFCNAMNEAGRNASLFSLLGWEAASLAGIALNAMTEHRNDVAGWSEKIKSQTFQSPRGLVSFDSESNYSYAPMYEAGIEENEHGNCALKIVSEITTVKQTLAKLNSVKLEQMYTGWYNSYTCN